MEKIYDSLIIGGGPCGYTAALYCASAGLNTLVIEKLSVGGQMALTGDIENYPGFDEGVDGFTLGMKMQNSAHKFGAVTEYTQVLSVDFSGKIKKVTTDSGDFFAKTVIIATGANPKPLGLSNESEYIGRGIHYCAHCDGRFYKGKKVVVVGGGNSAVTDAIYLSNLAKEVIVIHRRDSFRAAKVYSDKLLSFENVTILWDTVIKSFDTENDRVSKITVENTKTKSSTTIDCNGVFVSIGRSPETSLFKDILQLDDAGYIIAEEDTKTAIPGVFAAGDVRTKALRQIVTAASDGAVASHFALEYISENF